MAIKDFGAIISSRYGYKESKMGWCEVCAMPLIGDCANFSGVVNGRYVEGRVHLDCANHCVRCTECGRAVPDNNIREYRVREDAARLCPHCAAIATDRHMNDPDHIIRECECGVTGLINVHWPSAFYAVYDPVNGVNELIGNSGDDNYRPVIWQCNSCARAARRCQRCGVHVPVSHMIMYNTTSEDQAGFCPHCAIVTESDDLCSCGLYIAHRSHRNDGGCVVCNPPEYVPTSIVSYHSQRGDRLFKWGEKYGDLHVLPVSGKSGYIGLELELNIKNGINRHVPAPFSDILKGFAFISEDATVSWGEIVTKPTCLEKHKEVFSKLFALKLRNSYGLVVSNRSNRMTGLHINMSRTFWKDTWSLAATIILMNNWIEWSQYIAGRDVLYNVDWARKNKDEAENDAIEGTNKYQVVRVGKDRCEMRMYLSTTDISKLVGRIEHSLSTVDYTNQLDDGQLPELDDYHNFVDYHSAWYPSCHRMVELWHRRQNRAEV